MANDGPIIRLCGADDAAGLAEMYRLDRNEIEAAEPSRLPAFFETEGQLERITRVWPEHRTLGYVAVEDERILGLFLLEDVTDVSATVGYYVRSDRRRRGVATAGLGALVEVATGLSYLVILTAFGTDLVARAVLRP
jgi:RimJ/RimL family protein N-acetyltransferase